MQLAQRTLPPGQDVGVVHGLPDADRGRGPDRAVGDLGGALRLLQQVAQRVHRRIGLGQLGLQPAQVRGDQLVAVV
jgi:hypothetical protein